MEINKIVEDIIGLKRKNGNNLLSDSDIDILRRWGSLGTKEVTKFKKIVGTHLGKVVPLTLEEFKPGVTKKYPHLEVVRAYTYGDVTCLYVQYFSKSDFDTEEEYDAIVEFKGYISDLKKRFIEIIGGYLDSLRRNKISKSREEIKGKVNPSVLLSLQNLRSVWEVRMMEKYIESLSKSRDRASEFLISTPVIKGDDINTLYGFINSSIVVNVKSNHSSTKNASDYRVCTTEELQKIAKNIAEEEAIKWFYKMCDKLGGLLPDKEDITAKELYGNKTYDSTIKIESSKFSFMMVNSLVHNTSVLGNPYFQFPCVFKFLNIGGQVQNIISELELKKKLNSIV